MAVLAPGRASIGAAALACSLVTAPIDARGAACPPTTVPPATVCDSPREGADFGGPDANGALAGGRRSPSGTPPWTTRCDESVAPAKVDDGAQPVPGCGPQAGAQPPLWALGLLALGLGAALRARERAR